ncbi:hypothetical protein JCM30760_17090 [Thiomicrorhabdus hydrogeniphila]
MFYEKTLKNLRSIYQGRFLFIKFRDDYMSLKCNELQESIKNPFSGFLELHIVKKGEI